MKYEELADMDGFQRNMRKTPFLKLFPHWWGENDPLLKAIGDEVERIKALAIFGLLNAGLKPPVLLWQTSLTHDKYNVNEDITQLPAIIEIEPTLYKTWGDITLTNHTDDDIDGLEITFNGKDGFAINQLISKDDIIKIDLTENKVQLNNHTIKPQIIGKGMPYFITSQRNETYQEDTPLNNEIIRLKINTDSNLENTIISETINVTEKIDNWEVSGNAYQYNPKSADPWIAIEKGRIAYELNFNHITEINFLYKGDISDGETCTLNCYADGHLIHSFTPDPNGTFLNYTINPKEININETIINGESGEAETISIKELTGIGTLEFEHLDDGVIYLNEIQYKQQSKYHVNCDINVDINMNNAVFINEQNIEVTGLELIPIERIELYANYDFEYNKKRNGWQKVYQKKYEKKTNVIYDMVTTHFITKEFYVDVWFKTLQYPYRVGFPCYQGAESDSMFHVNNRLDTWGETLGLERRFYRTEIPEDEYYKTFPEYYPFDIEQDYWYYMRLANEYTWNDLAINKVDIQDTDGNAVFTLNSINPFCEDFVVHAKSRYPIDKKYIDYNEYYPSLIMQQETEGYVAQSEYSNIINLLGHNNYTSSVVLNNSSDNNDIIYKQVKDAYMEKNNITDESTLTRLQLLDIEETTQRNRRYVKNSAHVSKELVAFFDLTDLPEDVNIDDITITIEAESTDNKKNKFSTEDTGLIIPSLLEEGEDTFIPLTADKDYQLAKQSITYTIDDENTLKNIITTTDTNVIQKATIGKFASKINNFARIPFTIKENNTEITDFKNIYITYGDVKKAGKIVHDEDGKQYIYTLIPNAPMLKTMSIKCEFYEHMPFSTTIDIAKAIEYTENDDGEQVVDYEYIYGPLVDGQSVDIEVEEEWHTNDIRNILQKQGIYFRNTFINNDQQSSTTIILYNIKLEVHYSEKKTDFYLDTYVNKKDVVNPVIGRYEVYIKNIGDKPLKTSIDIFTPPNITLSENYIDVDLNIGAYIKKSIDIIPEYPIVDGVYDILAFCEDTIKKDSIDVFADGLIQTSVIIKPHTGKYNETITLSAEVKTVDGEKISGSVNQMQFYINDFAVGDPVSIYNNKATANIIPGNYKFTGTGTLKLEARFLGNTKYASSSGINTIFISKNSTRITIDAPKKAVYKGAYEAKAIVEYFDGEKYKPVNDGSVTFYANDEILSSNANSPYSNGIFLASLNSLENPPGDYVLKVRYEGSNVFASTESSQDFEIIGGDVEILPFDINIKPYDNIHLTAKVVDKNNKPVSYGYLDFICQELNINYQNISIKDGIGSTPNFNVNKILENDNGTEIIHFKVVYHGAKNEGENIYNDKQTTGNIIIKKGEAIIEYSTLYQASQYEPLGFLIRAKDAETNEYISEGTIKITLPNQNNTTLSAKIDENGTARLVYNLINFTGKEWQQLLKWSFSTNDDDSIGQKAIINNPNIPDYDAPYDAEYLYKIYDGDYTDITLVDFQLSADGKYLEYIGNKNDTTSSTERDVSEYIFIGEDGCLYAQTDIDEFRKYKTGLQDIRISFTSDGGYKSQTIELKNGLNISTQNVDLDVHSYDLTYADKDNIVCYVTKYNNAGANIPITNGDVQFIFDGQILETVPVENGLAVLKTSSLMTLAAGKYLLEVDYVKNNKNTTRSYSLINLKQATPNVTIETDRITRNKNTQITVKIDYQRNLDIPLSGMVTLYLNDEKIGEQYLYGNEILTGIVNHEGSMQSDWLANVPYTIFNYIMPYDVDIPNKYTLKAVYHGNSFFEAAESDIIPIKENPSPVTITSSDVDINKNINISVNEECNIDFSIQCQDDIIDEGVLYLIGGDNEIIASDNVVNNTATLKWTPSQIQTYTYILKYDKATHYENKQQAIAFHSQEGLNSITLPNKNYKSIKQALMCLQNNGTIYLNENIELNKTLNIYKDCNIIGANDVSIININKKDINIINSSNTHIENIHITSDENINIINDKYLVINRCILDKNINLHNNSNLMAQRNFIYGSCSGKLSDLNNNWWGSNTPPYDVDTHIIIEVEPTNRPAIIEEEIEVTGQMIGSNGREYVLPEADFTFGADTGYFSVDFGKTINHQIKTTYLDAEQEGQIYFTIDNQTVTCNVYEYERKTEVIIDNIDEVPINYQIPIKAKIQSVADIFYEFDNENNIKKNTTLINGGHILFYLNDEQVGYSPVVDGEAETIIFLTNRHYQSGDYILKAIYEPNEYYFKSESSIPISIINDNDACYVSLSGDDNNDGTFSSPFKTIAKAITQKQNIYLLDEYYDETDIKITSNINIKSFKNNTNFNSLDRDESIFDIAQDTILTLKGINFSNNLSTIFNNKGKINIDQCILYKNKKIFSDTGQEIKVKYSAIIDNTEIATNIDPLWFTYCWFGENNPSINGINNHVQMTKKASKNILYIGTLAYITGMLETYKRGMLTYKLDKPLPLRIAKFATTYGSMKPLKDYTYNNQSTSLLNTQQDNNTKQYIISIPSNINYIEHKVTLECSIIDVYDNYATGQVSMEVSGNNINTKRLITLNDGKGILNINRLNEGTYTLKCIYENNDDSNNIQTYTATKNFVVKKPDIIVKKFNIGTGDNLYYTTLDIELEDNFGNKINNEQININIDNTYITSVNVKKGIISQKISYDKLKNGNHTLSIDNKDNNSKYDNFIEYQTFNVKTKDVQILFEYESFEAGVSNNINIEILDDENVKVEGGYIDIEFDNEKIISNAEVVNGNINVNNFIIKDIGQHSITIHYSGLEGYYNEKLYINNYISVGIFNVIFGIKKGQYVSTNIGQLFNLTTTIKDVSNQLVNRGYVNVYIDDVLLNDIPVNIKNGICSIQSELPTNIVFGTYDLRLEYIDPSDMYLDTSLSTSLKVGKIPTYINVDTIHGSPGQKKIINYQVSTEYGNAQSGTLIAKYDNNIIGKSTITENITNTITINTPFVPDTDTYIIKFEYTDKSIYDDSTEDVILIIDKNNVKIEPSHTWYYPNETFYFGATILDQDNNKVNVGKATVYIDNVKETESQDVVNGKFTIPLKFNKAKEYLVNIVYEENDYYAQTIYPEETENEFMLKINSVDIEKISLKDDTTHSPLYYIENGKLYSLPNQLIKSELVFTTLDNYNVKDGIIDIKIDNITVNTYYVAEKNKYIDFNIGNIAKGEHELTIKYYGSSLFNDKEIIIPLTILSKQLQIKVNDNQTINVHNHKDTIDIPTVLYDASNNQPVALSGLLRYYIGLPIYKADIMGNPVINTYDYRFIGVEQLDNTSSNVYQYKLPTDLLEYSITKYETHYKIKAEFVGNDEYDAAENEIDLHIQKQSCNLTIDNSGNEFLIANYRDTIDINFDIDAEGSPLVHFYIEDKLIGSTIAKNKQGSFSYKLSKNYTVRNGTNYYTIRASFEGSAVDKPAEAILKMQVNPLMPKINTDDKEAYYGGVLELDNIIEDADGNRITDGTLTYTINDESITYNLNQNGSINIPNTQETQLILHVEYDTTNSNYMVFEKDININLKPNDVVLSVNAPDEIYRGENYNINVMAISETTNLPIDLVFNGDKNMTNGNLTLQFNLPATTPYEQVHNFTIASTGNQFFKPTKKTIQMKITNKNTITLDTTQETSQTNAQTLEKALDLVAEYGTIQIINAPEKQTATINKGVNITGEAIVNKWKITNNANQVSITGITFNNSTSNAIVNHGEILIDECIFNTGKDSAIYTNGAAVIHNCTFNGNSAPNGAGIYIGSNNYMTTIYECEFTENNVVYSQDSATGNGSCIYSDKGNDVDISNNNFNNNTGQEGITSSIWAKGNIYISSNTFYSNEYECEIYLIDGTLLAENNLFDGAIQSIKAFSGDIDADFNYWGYNDIEQIEARNSSLITFNNWLLSRRKDYYKEIEGVSKSIIVGVIEQYQNRFEKEITTISPIDKKYPVMVGSNVFMLNDEVQATPSAIVKIGQEEHSKGG